MIEIRRPKGGIIKALMMVAIVIIGLTISCGDDNDDGNDGMSMPYICTNGTPISGMTTTANTKGCMGCNSGYVLSGTQGEGAICERKEPQEQVMAGQIIITEIKGDKDEIDDYVEIYNTTEKTIKIAGFYVTDKLPGEEEGKKVFFVNQDEVIGPNEYLVICVKPGGNYDFSSSIKCAATEGEIGIGGEEEEGIRLKSPSGEIIDEVKAPIVGADSLKLNDASLELSSGHLDHRSNDVKENWGGATQSIHSIGADKGSPGARNTFSK